MRRPASLFFHLGLRLFFSSPAAEAVEDGDARLLKIVALSRHGVRSPTQDMKPCPSGAPVSGRTGRWSAGT